MDFWLLAAVVLPALAVVATALITLNAYEHRRYARSRLRTPPSADASPRVLLLAPCKGLELGLAENLRPLLAQDYDNYEISFILESADDPARRVIEELLRERPELAARIVVAGRAETEGQKVHNLRAATKALPNTVEILAFVDSDARPHAGWLRALVDRLTRRDCGAVTGYRWYLPDAPSLANALLYGANAGVASLFGTSGLHLVWGGSWAIRRELFDQLKLHEAWRGTISDDLVASRTLRAAGASVHFEPACVVASPCASSLGAMLEFLRRQYIIGRVYTPRWWIAGLLTAAIATSGFWVGLFAGGYGLAAGRPLAWASLALCAVHYALGVARATIRRDLARMYLGARRSRAADAAARFDVWLAPLTALVNLAAFFSSVVGRTITWRGISYTLDARGRVLELRRRDAGSAKQPEAARTERGDIRIDTAHPLGGPHALDVQQLPVDRFIRYED